jgi:hypothetical protein
LYNVRECGEILIIPDMKDWDTNVKACLLNHVHKIYDKRFKEEYRMGDTNGRFEVLLKISKGNPQVQ